MEAPAALPARVVAWPKETAPEADEAASGAAHKRHHAVEGPRRDTAPSSPASADHLGEHGKQGRGGERQAEDVPEYSTHPVRRPRNALGSPRRGLGRVWGLWILFGRQVSRGRRGRSWRVGCGGIRFHVRGWRLRGSRAWPARHNRRVHRPRGRRRLGRRGVGPRRLIRRSAVAVGELARLGRRRPHRVVDPAGDPTKEVSAAADARWKQRARVARRGGHSLDRRRLKLWRALPGRRPGRTAGGRRLAESEARPECLGDLG